MPVLSQRSSNEWHRLGLYSLTSHWHFSCDSRLRCGYRRQGEFPQCALPISRGINYEILRPALLKDATCQTTKGVNCDKTQENGRKKHLNTASLYSPSHAVSGNMFIHVYTIYLDIFVVAVAFASALHSGQPPLRHFPDFPGRLSPSHPSQHGYHDHWESTCDVTSGCYKPCSQSDDRP